MSLRIGDRPPAAVQRVTTTRKKRLQSEQELQSAIVRYLDMVLIRPAFVFAIPNGGARTSIEAAILKGQGVRAGIADLCIVWSTGGASPGAAEDAQAGFIELKAPSGDVSQEQVAVHDALRQLGFPVGVARSIDEVRDLLRVWQVPSRERV